MDGDSTRFHEAVADLWLLANDAGRGSCYACKRQFKSGETVVYETPDNPRRKWLLKIVRHKTCQEETA